MLPVSVSSNAPQASGPRVGTQPVKPRNLKRIMEGLPQAPAAYPVAGMDQYRPWQGQDQVAAAQSWAPLPASGYMADSPQMLADIRSQMMSAGMGVGDAQANYAAERDGSRVDLRAALADNRFNASRAYQSDMADLGATNLGRSGMGMGIAAELNNQRLADNAQARMEAARRQGAALDMLRAAQRRMALTQADVAGMRAGNANASNLLYGM
jgi:hypothetical protein